MASKAEVAILYSKVGGIAFALDIKCKDTVRLYIKG